MDKMIDENNKYTLMQRRVYSQENNRMSKTNHRHHDNNPDYYNILLREPKLNPEKYKDCVALDFGCGCGRNVDNLLKLAEWNRVDGIDISKENIEYCNKYLKQLGYSSEKFKFYTNNGVDVRDLKNDEYDYIISTIVFQHICVHEIRYSLLKDLFRTLKSGGIFSLQVALDKTPSSVSYYENFYDAQNTNSKADFALENPEYMEKDLIEIGFNIDEYIIRNSYSDKHEKWIYWKLSK